MSDSLPDEAAPQKADVKEELSQLDVKLKKLEFWVKGVGIALALLTTWNACGQNLLLWYQIGEQEEKQRVSVEMKMVPTEGPSKNGIYLSAALTNNSGRQVNIGMIGIRIWKQEWVEGNNVRTHPELLIYSDSKVANCPAGMCPRKTDKATLRNDDHPTVLASRETQTDTFGTYFITPEELRRGVWVEGFAYTVEQDEGTCVINGPPPAEGAFPVLCEERLKGQQGCQQLSNCKLASSAPFFYRPVEHK